MYSIAGHAGDWRAGGIPMRAARLNQPLVAFQSTAHAGALGQSMSLVSLTGSRDQVAVRALKKAEDSDEIVIRVQELYGRPADTRIAFAGQIVAAREINAAEEAVGPFAPTGGALDVSAETVSAANVCRAARGSFVRGNRARGFAHRVAVQPRRHLARHRSRRRELRRQRD